MDRAEEQYFSEMIDLFATEGWRELTTEAEDKLVVARRIDNIQTEKELWFRKGQINILLWLTGMENAIESVRNDIT